MLVTQVYEYVNGALKQTLGETAVINEDLSNIVDVGRAIENANAWNQYAEQLVDRIGRSVFKDKKYSGELLSVMRDSWEFGSILMRVDNELPQVTTNETWEIVEGASYDPFIYTPDKSVKARVYNGRVTFEIDRSIPKEQLKSSFDSKEEMNKFISMIFNSIENALTIATENLIKAGLRSLMADTIADDYGSAAYSSKSGVKAVNLLKLYNTEFGTTLTKAAALHTKDFLLFAANVMRDYTTKLKSASKLFNVEKRTRWTEKKDLHFVALSQFASRIATFSESDTYHNEMIALPKYEEINSWQGTGTEFSFDECSKIDVKSGAGNEVALSGIVGVMFDDYALACNNKKREIEVEYVKKATFFNYFYKDFMQILTDASENVVVFFLA